VDIIVGGFNIGWLKNRQESDSRMENLSGIVKMGYGKPGKKYNWWKNTRFSMMPKIESSLWEPASC
jgi:hypothetical protein